MARWSAPDLRTLKFWPITDNLIALEPLFSDVSQLATFLKYNGFKNKEIDSTSLILQESLYLPGLDYTGTNRLRKLRKVFENINFGNYSQSSLGIEDLASKFSPEMKRLHQLLSANYRSPHFENFIRGMRKEFF